MCLKGFFFFFGFCSLYVMFILFCLGYGSSYSDYLFLLKFTCSVARLHVIPRVLFIFLFNLLLLDITFLFCLLQIVARLILVLLNMWQGWIFKMGK
jgi:hypothetical protein